MAAIGTLTLDLEANTAQFHQEMGRAGGAIRSLGHEAGRGERQLVSFAARGIGVIVPEAEGAAHALLGLVERATKASGAFALLAKTGLLAGVAIGAFLVGQRLREEIDNWLELGETSKTTLERLKKEAEEQTKFATDRAKAINMLIGLEGQLAVARANASKAIAEGQNQPDVAASFAMRAELEAEKTAQRLRLRSAFEIADVDKRNQVITASNQLHAAKRLEIEEKYFAALGKLRDDAAAKTLDKFKTETGALLDNLQKRLDLRKALEERTTGLVESGAISDPFAAADKIRKAAAAEAEGFAFLLDKGRPWRDLQDEIFQKDQEFAAKGFSGFAASVDAARGKMRDLGIDAASIDTSIFTLAKSVGDDLPAGINRADPAIVQLVQRFQLMKNGAVEAMLAIQALAGAIATGGNTPAPVVLAPVDLGPQP